MYYRVSCLHSSPTHLPPNLTFSHAWMVMSVCICVFVTCLGKWCWACSYGSTANGKLVDSAGLQLLENMGFERAVAAEALKQVQHQILLCLVYEQHRHTN